MGRASAWWQWVCAASGILLAASGCSPVERAQAADSPHAEAIPVRLGDVAHGPLSRRVRASGTLSLKSEADLSFRSRDRIGASWSVRSRGRG